MFKRGIPGLFLIFLSAFTVPVWSQGVSGSIRGAVTDPNGQPLPGVRVFVRGATLIGMRETVTNEQGTFRFPSLPVGSYAVEARLHGFDTITTNRVDISVGGTADVPLRMRVSKVETITVEANNSLIDPQNSGFSNSYKQEMTQNLPGQRNMWLLIQVAPGVTTDYGDFQGGNSTIAFGSNRQSNSWYIDGMDASGPETGHPWVELNPDIIDQIQIFGVGAPAEYGNHSGAVFNVITKSGGNSLHGSFNSFFQTQKLTGVNVRLPDSDFVFHRDKFYDISAQSGGPIKKDKVWFFGSVESWRDSSTPPGIDPNDASLLKQDRYNAKISARLGERYDLSTFVQYENYDTPDLSSPYISPSASGRTVDQTPAWGATLTSARDEHLLLEFNYAGWRGHELYGSQTGSLENPIVEYSTIPFSYSGGLWFPYDYHTYRHQGNAKATYYADHFLKSRHEFKFGAQYSYGSGTTVYSLGSNGFYLYRGDPRPGYDYSFGYYQAPFLYGATSRNIGIYVDDSAELSKRLTLNLGLRFDRITGSIPDYDRLEVGTPSITSVGNFKSTGEKIPGIDDYVNWKLLSPRLGFVWRMREDGRTALRGSFGVYYENDVFGNWDAPPPDAPPFYRYIFDFNGKNVLDGPFEVRGSTVLNVNNLKPPRSRQYSLGYEFQTTNDSSLDVLYVHKTTDQLIGWQNLGGQWSSFIFTDPFTERQYTMYRWLDVDPPTLQKGNDPGNFPGSEGLRYFQQYDGLVITFTKRFSNDWTLNASYTWSKSYGLIPRMISQSQFQPFYGNGEGSDVNQYINAKGYLQADRTHMFRAQAVFSRLPWNLRAASSIEFSSGRRYNRQIALHPGASGKVNMETPGSRRHSPIQNIDLSLGKQIPAGDRIQLRLEGQILNLLNSNQELSFASLVLFDPSQTFIPSAWVQPRRLQLRLGLSF